MPPPTTKVCIFCGQRPLTKEHVWSKWTYEFVPRRDGTHTRTLSGGLTPHLLRLQLAKKFQGDVNTLKIRVVCAKCNNGWMSAVDERAKPILKALFMGERFVLDVSNAAQAIEWAIMKFMVCEFAPYEEHVSSQQQRTAVMHRELPEDWQLWICHHRSDKWRSGIVRTAFSISNTTEDSTEPIGSTHAKDTQFVLLGIGQLLIVAFSSTVPGRMFTFSRQYSHIMRQLLPTDNAIQWPPLVTLQDADINYIISIFDNYLKSIKWTAISG